MKVISKIKLPVETEMELFEKKFTQSMSSKVALLNRITHFIVNRKGKQMRPMFVFLVAKMVSDGKVNERTYRGASVIELIHTATLVHDDVVDDSNRRRGFFSINALWKNKIAVLVGDYLLSKGLLLSIDNNDFDLLKIISVAVREMSEGELLQIEKARRLDITEDIYYEIISRRCQAGIPARSRAPIWCRATAAASKPHCSQGRSSTHVQSLVSRMTPSCPSLMGSSVADGDVLWRSGVELLSCRGAHVHRSWSAQEDSRRHDHRSPRGARAGVGPGPAAAGRRRRTGLRRGRGTRAGGRQVSSSRSSRRLTSSSPTTTIATR